MKLHYYASLAGSGFVAVMGQNTEAQEELFRDIFMGHVGTSGHNHPNTTSDAVFYETNANLPQFPFLSGHVGTAGTYRHLSVQEQTFFMIGEPKHGLWRVQDNGHVRMYRREGRLGLNQNTNLRGFTDVDRIRADYVTGAELYGTGAYRYPDQEVTVENADQTGGRLNFIDLSIHHEYFNGTYADHVPIDLPFYYCTMSSGGFAEAKNLWEYVKAQPSASNWGPLAQRAGLDVKENTIASVRMDLFSDAKLWINRQSNTLERETTGTFYYDIDTDYVPVEMDTDGFDYEIYLIERPFFGAPYLFLCLVVDDTENDSHSYVRPDGDYWVDIEAATTNFGNGDNELPLFPVRNNGRIERVAAYNTPAYALAHADRNSWAEVEGAPSEDGIRGGACPSKGGDYGRYPWGDQNGAGWPINYEEIGPLCDALLLDIKFWGNLDDGDEFNTRWDDPSLAMANAGTGSERNVEYVMEPNNYGYYTDDYLLRSANPDFFGNTENQRNRWAMQLRVSEDRVSVADSTNPAIVGDLARVRINFAQPGTVMDYVIPDMDRMNLTNVDVDDDDDDNSNTAVAQRFPAMENDSTLSMWRVRISQTGVRRRVPNRASNIDTTTSVIPENFLNTATQAEKQTLVNNLVTVLSGSSDPVSTEVASANIATVLSGFVNGDISDDTISGSDFNANIESFAANLAPGGPIVVSTIGDAQ